MLLESRINGVRRRGRPGKNSVDDIKAGTNVKDYSDFNRRTEDGKHGTELARLPSMYEDIKGGGGRGSRPPLNALNKKIRHVLDVNLCCLLRML